MKAILIAHVSTELAQFCGLMNEVKKVKMPIGSNVFGVLRKRIEHLQIIKI